MRNFVLAAAMISSVFAASAASAHDYGRGGYDRGSYDHYERGRESCCRGNGILPFLVGGALFGSRGYDPTPGYLPPNYYGRPAPVVVQVVPPAYRYGPYGPAWVPGYQVVCYDPRYTSTCSTQPLH